MKLRNLFEGIGHLFVDDEFDEIADKPWDSGLTPRQVVMHLIKGVHPELAGSYDVEGVKHAMGKLKQYREVPPELAVEVDNDMDVVDGYHRLTAAKILGIAKYPYKEF